MELEGRRTVEYSQCTVSLLSIVKPAREVYENLIPKPDFITDGHKAYGDAQLGHTGTSSSLQDVSHESPVSGSRFISPSTLPYRIRS